VAFREVGEKCARSTAAHGASDLCAPAAARTAHSSEGKDPEEMRRVLGRQHIHVLVTSRSSTLLDMEARGLESMARASVHY
jgi:hypothetical protein